MWKQIFQDTDKIGKYIQISLVLFYIYFEFNPTLNVAFKCSICRRLTLFSLLLLGEQLEKSLTCKRPISRWRIKESRDFARERERVSKEIWSPEATDDKRL